jgi:hypothetical protein
VDPPVDAISPGQSAVSPALAVDWQTEMCVVVALGTRSTGGYFILIDMIEAILSERLAATCVHVILGE